MWIVVRISGDNVARTAKMRPEAGFYVINIALNDGSGAPLVSSDETNSIGSSWRQVIRKIEDDDRVKARHRPFVSLAKPQGLIGSTLLVAVPNDLTRDILQTQLREPLDQALREVFQDDIRCAVSVDLSLAEEVEQPPEKRPRQLRSQFQSQKLPDRAHSLHHSRRLHQTRKSSVGLIQSTFLTLLSLGLRTDLLTRPRSRSLKHRQKPTTRCLSMEIPG